MQIETNSFVAPGFLLGHWTHPNSSTGCTVLLAESLVPAAVEVRGGSPGTRETDLLSAGRAVQRVDAVLLTGGSAFGLAAADGVVRWLHERGRGFPTAATPVPIVAGAVIYDLQSSEPVWPGSEEGYFATESATERWHGGAIGGGSGATVSKALGRDFAISAGVGIAQVTTPSGVVSAVFVNNACGDVYDPDSACYITCPGNGGSSSEQIFMEREITSPEGQNTVIGAIAVSRRLDHDALTRIAVSGQSGIARVIRPSHTPADGDTVFSLATGYGPCTATETMQLTTAAQIVASRAILASVKPTI